MKFWAYENWRAKGHVVKVHGANCPHCNQGAGRGGTHPTNGKWHSLGELAGPQEALVEAKARVPSAWSVRFCGTPNCLT